MTPPAALDGIRILDFTRVLAGPFCTMLLADFGADVIKIEHPNGGDETRSWGPPWAGEGTDRQSAYYLSVNRNKRSLTLDLKSAEGQTIARQLAAKSDVVIENFKVGQMRGYGLDYETLHKEHPELVYCSITGYGQTGPYAQIPGYDFIIQGQSGLMSITGPVDGTPYKVGVAISDVVTGLYAANAIQAALHYRTQSGLGQYIDVSLLESQMAALVNVASNFLVSQNPPQRYGNAHANIVPYQVFEAADGFFSLAVGNDAQFRRCCEVLGNLALAEDSRFATNPARVANRESLIAILQQVFMTHTAQEWVERFIKAGVPAGTIDDISSAFDNPQLQARELVQSIDLTNGATIETVGPTPKLSETPPTIRCAPPELGQDTDQILRDLLGIDETRLTDYHQQNII